MVSLQQRSHERGVPSIAARARRALTFDDVFAGPLGRPGRRDALPEHTRYLDSGCDLHASCLSCPLARCRHDEPRGVRGILSRDRDGSILELRRRENLTVEAIALRFGVSRRTVFRVLARARDGGPRPC